MFFRKNKSDLLKMYPDKTENDYFIWIAPDFYTPFEVNDVYFSIGINNEIVFSNMLQKPAKIKLRRPYPNKNIIQFSLQKGRSVCYGIPIKVTLKELKEIEKIHIFWQIHSGSYFCTAKINYDFNISDYSTLDHIIPLRSQIDWTANALDCAKHIGTFDVFVDVYCFVTEKWIDENIIPEEGLHFSKKTNAKDYDNFDANSIDFDALTNVQQFFIDNQAQVVLNSLGPEKNIGHICLYKNITNVSIEKDKTEYHVGPKE